MRRAFHKLTGQKSDKNAAEAEATATNSTTDTPVDDTAFGLNMWVEGVNPVVE
jgi:hypothetical protein